MKAPIQRNFWSWKILWNCKSYF